jgi:hypothetical protein
MESGEAKEQEMDKENCGERLVDALTDGVLWLIQLLRFVRVYQRLPIRTRANQQLVTRTLRLVTWRIRQAHPSAIPYQQPPDPVQVLIALFCIALIGPLALLMLVDQSKNAQQVRPFWAAESCARYFKFEVKDYRDYGW